MGIGALMNARELMELIVVNIGLQRGIIGPALFPILVLMAGDGLIAGPAPAAADVSITPESASDFGRQAADFVFLGDGLTAIPRGPRMLRAVPRFATAARRARRWRNCRRNGNDPAR